MPFPLNTPVPMKLYYVYALINQKHEVYIGYTANILQRILAHNAGAGAPATRGRGPWALFYLECYASETDARDREREMIWRFARDRSFPEATRQSRKAAVQGLSRQYEEGSIRVVNGTGIEKRIDAGGKARHLG